VYCSIDKIDLAAQVDGETIAVQADDRARDDIEAEPELSVLFAMARVLNARSQLADDGHPVRGCTTRSRPIRRRCCARRSRPRAASSNVRAGGSSASGAARSKRSGPSRIARSPRSRAVLPRASAAATSRSRCACSRPDDGRAARAR